MMTAKNSTFSTLQSLAEKTADQAAQQLGRSQNACREAQSQLDMLCDYYREYQEQLNRSMMTGLNGHQLGNFQDFMTSLERSITQQKAVLTQLKAKQQQALQYWQACQQRLNAYATLLKKQAQQAALKENKLQQKLIDEFALQQTIRKNML